MSIAVKNEELRRCEAEYKKLSQKLSQIENSLQTIRKSLDSDIKHERNIDNDFKKVCEDVDQSERSLTDIAKFLSDTVKAYESAEKNIEKDLNKLSQKKSGTNIFSNILDKLSSIRKKAEAILKILLGFGIFGAPIGTIITLNEIKKYYAEKGITVNNKEEKPIEIKKADIPELSGILSYDPSKYKEEVLLLQKRLNELKITDDLGRSLEEDGKFGKNTLAAVNKYKEQHGLWNFGEYEGKVGKTTWEHLFTHGNVNAISEKTKIGEENGKANVIPKSTIRHGEYAIAVTFDQALQNEDNAKWYNKKTGKTTYACVKKSGDEWVRASTSEIRYYLDPNNFINDPVKKYQFLVLDNNSSIAITPENKAYLVKEINKILVGKGVLEGKGSVFVKAAEDTGISLPYLVAHCALETGWGTSKLSRGIDKNGNNVGYYNMFGIEAYDSDPIGNGIAAAKKYDWNSVDAAIVGGAKWINEHYTSNSAKNTLYKMKWQPSDPLGLGQYATDIAWASKQCETIKKLYDLFPDAELKFEIPVYSENLKIKDKSVEPLKPEGVYPSDSWKPCQPAITNSVGKRSAETYKLVIDQFEVASKSNIRYKPNKKGNGDTYCNIFAWDVTSAMGAEIPHWVDNNTGEPRKFPEVTGAHELNANGIAKWLKEHGSQYGWKEVSASEAQNAANSGKPAVVSWYNNYYKGANGTRVFDETNQWSRNQYAGHIAVVRPEDKSNYPNVKSSKGIYIAQAGSNNYNYNGVEKGFSETKMNQTEYFRYYIHE